MEYLKFTVDSALLRELREKLVETVHLALIELVKNSYDADATNVEISFGENEHGESEIIIIDDGIGMNFEAVQDYWMRIATTIKAEKKISPVFGRPRTGAKGIGRFCCRRLGGKLKLITLGAKEGKSRGSESLLQKTIIEFPWSKFEPGTEVTEIRCLGERTTVNNNNTGTQLIISEINKGEWTTQGFNWLKRQLAVLAANRGIYRTGFEHDPGFEIKLVAPDFEGGIRDIREEVINAGWGTLTAHINGKHQAVCELSALGIGKKTRTSSKIFPSLQDISVKLGIMVDLREQMRDTRVLSLGTLQKILPEWGGVQVRYRGFRVYPYGDDDWLDIDHDRGLRRGTPKDELLVFAKSLKGVDAGRSLLNLLSMRSYMGNVEIGPKATGFEMKSNREGFLSSQDFEELKNFVRYAIDWSTIYRDYYLRNKLKVESDLARMEFEESSNQKIEPEKVVDNAIQYIKSEVKNIVRSLPQTERKQVEESINNATQVIKKQDEFNKEELAHLRLIASTSTLLLIFSHEVHSLLGMLEFSKNALENLETKLSSEHGKPLNQVVREILEVKKRFEDLLGLTSLISIDSRKAKLSEIALKERIIQSVKAFQLILNNYDINIDYQQVPNNIVIKNILEAEIYSILLNVLSNSIKSVIAAGGDRKIQIVAFREKGRTIIQFKDNGLGIDPANYDEVFIPFIADPDNRLYLGLDKMLNHQDKYIVGTGSGLGLSIVREIVKVRNGSIKFQQPSKGWMAELEIVLS